VCDTAAVTLRVVGAGLPRTGTTSLKEALTTLVGGPCYHMFELFGHPEHLPSWQAATDGEPVDWTTVFGGFRAAVDWPTSAFWPELIDAYPDAIVLLSTRSSPETWWASASSTVFPAMRSSPDPDESDWTRMIFSMVESRFTADFDDETSALRAYAAHNAAVRDRVPAERLLDWQPGDGWEPICERLGVAVPDEPFPHSNTGDDFRANLLNAVSSGSGDDT